jgi:glycosyltransferase involved in cell wall biosynthesis
VQDRSGRPPIAPPRVAILLALYNGAAHLAEQLDSYAAQSLPDWALIVSDDGSTDGTGAILDRFAAAHPDRRITRQAGPGQGFVRNFFSLLRSVPADVPHAALSDQDDVWFPDKLARAVAALAAVPPGVPGLYCAGSLICDAALRPLGESAPFPRPPAFRNALVQSIGGGNTMVLNRAALDLVRAAVDEAQDAVAHDWWLYQIITGCGGQVIRDPQPVLHYRQHGANLIGANLSLRARLGRIRFILGRRFCDWNDINLAALHRSRHRLTPEARAALDAYSAARQGGLVARLSRLRASGVWRQSRAGTAALYLACGLRRI